MVYFSYIYWEQKVELVIFVSLFHYLTQWTGRAHDQCQLPINCLLSHPSSDACLKWPLSCLSLSTPIASPHSSLELLLSGRTLSLGWSGFLLGLLSPGEREAVLGRERCINPENIISSPQPHPAPSSHWSSVPVTPPPHTDRHPFLLFVCVYASVHLSPYGLLWLMEKNSTPVHLVHLCINGF